MNDNVAMFDEFDDVHQIAASHLGLPRIVLEGKDDVRLFKQYWFTGYMDRVDFVEASELVAGSGCTAVAAAVVKSRTEDSIPAYGLVDRDWLFRNRHWDHLFATKDADFEAATTTDAFYTTRRWEIEAYLLEPDLIASVVRSFTRTPHRSEAECSAALGQALQELQQMLHAQRMYVAFHVAGVGLPPQHFVHKLADELEAACEEALGHLADEGGQAAAAIVAPLVQAVVGASPISPPERWTWFLRFVDTKRLMARLDKRFGTVGDVRWFLAEIMQVGDRRPAELEKRIKDVIAA